LPRFVPRILQIAKITSHTSTDILIGINATKQNEINIAAMPEKSILSLLLSVSMPYPFIQDKWD
jgi:hypothetical protein